MDNRKAIKNMLISGLSFAAGLIGLAAAVKNIRSKNRVTGALLALTSLLNIVLGTIHSVKYIQSALEEIDGTVSDCDFCCDSCEHFESCANRG